MTIIGAGKNPHKMWTVLILSVLGITLSDLALSTTSLSSFQISYNLNIDSGISHSTSKISRKPSGK
jgi:hypothetical protein